MTSERASRLTLDAHWHAQPRARAYHEETLARRRNGHRPSFLTGGIGAFFLQTEPARRPPDAPHFEMGWVDRAGERAGTVSTYAESALEPPAWWKAGGSIPLFLRNFRVAK